MAEPENDVFTPLCSDRGAFKMRAGIPIFYAAMFAACAIHQPPADHTSMIQTDPSRPHGGVLPPAWNSPGVSDSPTARHPHGGSVCAEANITPVIWGEPDAQCICQ